MNITLRKASALQNAINDALKHIDTKTEVALTEFHNPEHEIANAIAELNNSIVRKENLTRALYAIRASVADANHNVGVNARLTQVAFVEKQIQIYSALASKTEREPAEVIAGKLEKIKNDKSDRRIFGYNDTVNTSVLSKEDLQSYKNKTAKLKQDKQKLQDEILEANVRTEVNLSGETIETLQAEGLL